MKCFQCGEEINNRNTKHIYHCKNRDKSITNSEIKLKHIIFTSKIKINKKILVDLYINKLMSLPELKELTGLSYRSIQWILNFYEIPQRNIKKATSLDKTRNKYRKTCKKKYGVDNVSKLELIKNKKKKTFKKNYGVDNIWKDKRYYEWLHGHMLEKYGKKSVPNINGNANPFGIKTISEKEKLKRISKANKGYTRWWNSLSETEKDTLIKKRVQKLHNHPNSFKSSLEQRVDGSLSRNNIKFKRQKWIKRKSYDFHVINSNIIIEVQGTYWHADPRFYTKNQIAGGGLSSELIWEKDLYKKTLAENYGYEVIYLWENDLNKMTKEELDEFLKNKIKNHGKNNKNKKSQ